MKAETKKQNGRVKSEECWGLGMSECPWKRLCHAVSRCLTRPCPTTQRSCEHNPLTLLRLSDMSARTFSPPNPPLPPPKNKWMFHSARIKCDLQFAVCSSLTMLTSGQIEVLTSSHVIETVQRCLKLAEFVYLIHCSNPHTVHCVSGCAWRSTWTVKKIQAEAFHWITWGLKNSK